MSFTIAISKTRVPFTRNTWTIIFAAVFLLVWASSLIGTTDPINWVIENSLTFIFVVFLALTYKKHQFSDLSYLLICVYLCLHVYGSKYTYAENPLGYWLQDQFHTSQSL